MPKACINAAEHYFDLADDRRFVCDVAELDTQTKEKSVLAVRGASYVPRLTSTVIEQYQKQF